MDDKTSDEIRNLISFDRNTDNETDSGNDPDSDKIPENNIDDDSYIDEDTASPDEITDTEEEEENTDAENTEKSDAAHYADAEKLIRLVVSNSEKAAEAAKVRAKSHWNLPKTAKKSNRKTGRKKGSILGKRSKRAGQSFIIREEGSDFVVLNIPFLNFLNHEGEEEYYPELKADYRPPKKKKKKVRRPKKSVTETEAFEDISESAEYTKVTSLSEDADISENNDYTRVTPVTDNDGDSDGEYTKVIPINADNIQKSNIKIISSADSPDSDDNTEYDTDSYDYASYDEYEEYTDYDEYDSRGGNKSKKTKIRRRPLIIAGVLILAAAVAFTAVGLRGGTHRGGFNIFRSPQEPETQEAEAEYITETAFSKIIPYESANDSVYSVYSDGILCATSNRMQYINSDGEIEWEMATAVINPLISVNGKYILLAEQGGTKICLYENTNLLYDAKSGDKILSAEVSANGDSVFVTSKDLFKGAIYALNKSGDVIYSWASGNCNITAATISSDSRNIAAALLNTDDTVSSQINIFDITKTDPVASVEFDNTLIFNLYYRGKNIYAFGDNTAIALSSVGEKKFELKFEEAELLHSSISENSDFLLMRDKNNVPSISYYKPNGNEKYSTAVSDIADYIVLKNNRMLYNSGRDILLSHTDGRKPYKYTAGMDIHGLMMIDKNEFFIIYSNSVELVKF